MASAAPLPNPLRQRIAALIARDGERTTRARLGGIARQTIARAIAGLPIAAGTHALLRQRLDAAEAEDARRRWSP